MIMDMEDNTVYAQFASDTIVAKRTDVGLYGYEDQIGKTYNIVPEIVLLLKTIYISNHQKYVKLSGYVWINETQGKTSTQNDVHDDGENGLDGVKVYLKDKNGNTVTNKDGQLLETTTSDLKIYSEITGGQYRFEGVDLDKLQQGEYHVEYEYNGMRYKAIDAINLNKTTGSKAKEYEITRNILNDKFQTVNGTGSQNLTQGNISINYKDRANYVSNLSDDFYKATYTNANVVSSTSEAGYIYM